MMISKKSAKSKENGIFELLKPKCVQHELILYYACTAVYHKILFTFADGNVCAKNISNIPSSISREKKIIGRASDRLK